MSADNGGLDVDCVNAPCSKNGKSLDPIENIAFSPSTSERLLRGEYKIEVDLYGRKSYSSGTIPFTVAVKAGGCLRVFEDSFSGNSGVRDVFTLQYGGVGAPGTTGLLSRMELARQAKAWANARRRLVARSLATGRGAIQ